MRMAWWVFMGFIAVQVTLMQFMVEEYLAGEHEEMWYYIYALGFTFLTAWVTYRFFRRIDDARQ